MVSIAPLQLACILFALAFFALLLFCFCVLFFLFICLSCWLGILHLKEPGTFFFQFCKVGRVMIF